MGARWYYFGWPSTPSTTESTSLNSFIVDAIMENSWKFHIFIIFRSISQVWFQKYLFCSFLFILFGCEISRNFPWQCSINFIRKFSDQKKKFPEKKISIFVSSFFHVTSLFYVDMNKWIGPLSHVSVTGCQTPSKCSVNSTKKTCTINLVHLCELRNLILEKRINFLFTRAHSTNINIYQITFFVVACYCFVVLYVCCFVVLLLVPLLLLLLMHSFIQFIYRQCHGKFLEI